MKVGILIPEMSASLADALKEAATWGADGVQFYVKNPHYDLLTADNAEIDAIRTLLRTLHFELPAICGELGGHGFQIEAENPEKLAMTKRIVDIAERLETNVVSTHIGVVPRNPADPTYAVMVRAMSEIGRYAAKRGITVAIETGPEEPHQLRKFIEATDGGVGANLDPANLAMVQNVDSVEAVKVLAPYIAHTHAKDGVNCQPCDPVQVYTAFAEGGFAKLVETTGELFREVPLGEGQVDFPRYLPALKAAGYDGFLTIEREVGADPGKDIRMAVGFLRQQIALLK